MQNVVYMKDWLSCFWEEIKSLINRLSTRVVAESNLLCKVRFEVFGNIINYYLNKTKPVNIVIKVIVQSFNSYYQYSKKIYLKVFDLLVKQLSNHKLQTTKMIVRMTFDIYKESIQLLVCKEEIKILLKIEFSYLYHSYCNRLVIIIRNSWFG